MAVPNTNDFSLQNVADEIGGWITPPGLSDCFTFSVASNFDPKYEGEKDRLYNFRNYGPGGTLGEITGTDSTRLGIESFATASCPSSDWYVSCSRLIIREATVLRRRKTGIKITARPIQQYSFLGNTDHWGVISGVHTDDQPLWDSGSYVRPYAYFPSGESWTGVFDVPLNPNSIYMVSNDIIFVVADFSDGEYDRVILTLKIQPTDPEGFNSGYDYEIVLVDETIFSYGANNPGYPYSDDYEGLVVGCDDTEYLFVSGRSPSYEYSLAVFKFNHNGIIHQKPDEIPLVWGMARSILYQNGRIYLIRIGYAFGRRLLSLSVSASGILGEQQGSYNLGWELGTSPKLCGDGERLLFVFSNDRTLRSFSHTPEGLISLKDSIQLETEGTFNAMDYNAATNKIYTLNSIVLRCLMVDENDDFVLRSQIAVPNSDIAGDTGGYCGVVANTMYPDMIVVRTSEDEGSLDDYPLWKLYRIT